MAPSVWKFQPLTSAGTLGCSHTLHVSGVWALPLGPRVSCVYAPVGSVLVCVCLCVRSLCLCARICVFAGVCDECVSVCMCERGCVCVRMCVCVERVRSLCTRVCVFAGCVRSVWGCVCVECVKSLCVSVCEGVWWCVRVCGASLCERNRTAEQGLSLLVCEAHRVPQGWVSWLLQIRDNCAPACFSLTPLPHPPAPLCL